MKIILFLFSQILFITPLLAEFNAHYINNKVEIFWSSSATKTSHFIIERSENGKNFKETMNVKSGEKNTEYYEIDYHPPKKMAYYRIKYVNSDGNYKYSKTVLVKNYNKLKYYGNFKKALKGYKGRNILVVLKNNQGKEFCLKADITEYKKQLYAMGDLNLEPETYLIVSTSDDVLLNKKVTIIGREETTGDDVYTQNIK